MVHIAFFLHKSITARGDKATMRVRPNKIFISIYRNGCKIYNIMVSEGRPPVYNFLNLYWVDSMDTARKFIMELDEKAILQMR